MSADKPIDWAQNQNQGFVERESQLPVIGNLTVAELLVVLQKMPPDLPVFINYDDEPSPLRFVSHGRANHPDGVYLI